MSYIEDIRSLGRDANPFFRLMGINLGPLGKGVAELSMPVRPDMLNGVGWLQGGLFTALSDEAMALALFTVLDEGEGIATISESTSFLQGIHDCFIAGFNHAGDVGHRAALHVAFFLLFASHPDYHPFARLRVNPKNQGFDDLSPDIQGQKNIRLFAFENF